MSYYRYGKMKKIARYVLGGALALTLAACSNDQDFYYQDTARVRLVGPDIWTVGSDSLTFSFVTYPADTTEKVMMVDAVVMGPVADHDRTVTIAVDETRTTASAQQYAVPASVVIPAGKASAAFPVTLRRDASLQTKAVRLYLQVVASPDFQPGVNEENHLKLTWNDILSKPANWDKLQEYFGDYSNTKYRFMIANADGITEFDTDQLSWGQLMNLRIKFQNALQAYNDAHPGNPLKDENGVLVEF